MHKSIASRKLVVPIKNQAFNQSLINMKNYFFNSIITSLVQSTFTSWPAADGSIFKYI